MLLQNVKGTKEGFVEKRIDSRAPQPTRDSRIKFRKGAEDVVQHVPELRMFMNWQYGKAVAHSFPTVPSA